MDKQAMLNAIQHCKFQADPNNPDSSDPATIKDVKRIIEKTAELMTTLVNQLND